VRPVFQLLPGGFFEAEPGFLLAVEPGFFCDFCAEAAVANTIELTDTAVRQKTILFFIKLSGLVLAKRRIHPWCIIIRFRVVVNPVRRRGDQNAKQNRNPHSAIGNWKTRHNELLWDCEPKLIDDSLSTCPLVHPDKLLGIRNADNCGVFIACHLAPLQNAHAIRLFVFPFLYEEGNSEFSNSVR
jgi:hypothetical protein